MQRVASGTLGWAGPAQLLFARSAFALVAQRLVAAWVAAQGSAEPWREAGRWLPVYGSLIDAACLVSLWRLARREGITLLDLTGFQHGRLGRDMLLGLALIPPSLLLILAGIMGSNLLVYGHLGAPDVFVPLPPWAALYAMLVFPLLWGITEQATYNGYLLPRLQVLSGSPALAVAAVALSWSLQHAVMPVSFPPSFMLYRALAPLPFATFQALMYLRLRRITPLATAHWLMDGGDAVFRTLLPLFG